VNEKSEAVTTPEGKETGGFEPRLLAFVCNWCTYAAADLAGTSRTQYPPNIKLVRLMCSGAVDPVYVLRALAGGFDGVLIGGCRPGDCHYQSGNYKARRRITVLREILRNIGLDEDRVWLRWISASEGSQFAATVNEMVEHLRGKGHSELTRNWNK
jgi:F420-non-reducing hydrogenase iron-sulfur subunit